MNELLNNMTAANDICQIANAHYRRADQLEQQIGQTAAALKKAKVKWALIGLGVYLLVGMLASQVIRGSLATAGLLCFLIIVLPIWVGTRGYKKEKSSVQAAIDGLRTAIQNEQAAARQVFEDNADKLSFLPADYRYPLAIEYMTKLIQTGRAQTLGDALDRFEAQLHRWKLETNSAQMITLQQQQTAYLASIKTSSKISAIANVGNTVFNIASRL